MITVAGLTPSLDVTYLVDTLTPGAIHRPTAVVRCAGGKPLNLARTAHALSADVTLVALLGGPTGDTLAALLAIDGVPTVVVPTPAPTRTCVSIAAADTGALTEVYEWAAPVPVDVLRNFHTALATAVVSRPGWLVLSGSPPREHPAAEVAALVRIGHDAGRAVAVDTHGPALPAALAERPELVKINRYEAAELLGRSPDSELAELAVGVADRSSGSVVLTDGVAGSLAWHDGIVTRVAAPAVSGRFPVGSGDAYLGGLLSVLDGGGDWERALRTAAAAGAANAAVPGPGVLDPATLAEVKD